MTATALIGGALMVAGMGIQYTAQQNMIDQQTKISKKAENIRKQQMLLDGNRRRRQSIREGLLQRSMATVNGATQGAGMGSGVAAGRGAGIAAASEGAQTVAASSVLGGRMFDLNSRYFDVSQQGQQWMAIGQGMSSIGGTVLGNAGQINALGETYGPRAMNGGRHPYMNGW